MDALIKSPPINEHAIDLYSQPSPNVQSSGRLTAAPVTLPEPAPDNFPATSTVEDAPLPRVEEPKAVPATPQDAGPTADQIAEARLNELLQAHQVSLTEAEAKAVAEGFTKGLADGQRKGEERYAAGVQALAALVESGQRSVADRLRESEEVIAAIVFEAVSKIVGKEMTTAEGCAAVVRQVIAKTGRDEIVSVHISPKDHRRLEADSASNSDAPWSALLASLPVEPDERVELGGCILTLKAGSIDGRIETQFRTFAQSLKDAVKER